MATNYPSSLDTSSEQPSPSSTTDLDASGYEHDVVHTNHSGAIIALETKLGTGDSNAVANAVLIGTGSGTSEWDTSPTFTSTVTASAFAGPLTGDVTGNVSGTAATVTGAAQSNITSVGTLTGLTVGGDIVPDSDDTHDLGADGTEWNNLWIDVVKCTNEIQLADGSSSDPSLTFSSDGNTGIYRKASDQLAITCGSSIHYFGTDGLHLGSGDWFRAYGSTGIYNATYGTGMYSTDSTWFKGYSSSHGIQSQGAFAANVSSTSSLSGYKYVVRSGWTSFHYYTSSREHKDQISNFTDSGPIIDALNPVMFVSKPDPEDTPEEAAWRANDWNYGFIAEEICENDVTAKLGQYDPEFKPDGWKWPDVISVLTAEVKSLRARVAVLEGS